MNGPLVAARGIHLASTLLLAGTLAFHCFVAAPAFRRKPGAVIEKRFRIWLTRIIWTALAVGAVSGAGWLAFLAGEIADTTAFDAVSQGLAWSVLTRTTFGNTWMLRTGMASLLAVLLLVPRPKLFFEVAMDVVSMALAAGLAASLAWAGHAAATQGIDGIIHLTSDALHLLAASAWLGALWPLALLLGSACQSDDPMSATVAREATQRFSIMGMISVATVLATGVINTGEILGTLALSTDADYDRTLLAKIGLFVIMVAVAAFNRLRLTPRLSVERDHRRAMRQLQRNSLTEIGLGLLILAIVAFLGRMPPHVHHMHGG